MGVGRKTTALTKNALRNPLRGRTGAGGRVDEGKGQGAEGAREAKRRFGSRWPSGMNRWMEDHRSLRAVAHFAQRSVGRFSRLRTKQAIALLLIESIMFASTQGLGAAATLAGNEHSKQRAPLVEYGPPSPSVKAGVETPGSELTGSQEIPISAGI